MCIRDRRDAAAQHPAASACAAVGLRVIAPDFLAGACIDRERDAPVGLTINDAVCEEWRSFLLAAAFSDFVRPREAQLSYVGSGDLSQCAVCLLYTSPS